MTVKIAVFDFDSTLMDGETLEFLADEFGLRYEIAQITKEAMEGKLDFFESLTKRVALLKGLSQAKVEKICADLPLMNGAKETISELKRAGYSVVCFSGGFESGTVPAMKKLGYNAEFANSLHFKDGYTTGLVSGHMMCSDSKGKMLKSLQNLFNISSENTVAIGDGANDLSMFKYAGKKVAFCAKPILKQNANIIVDTKDLTLILPEILG